MANTDVILEKPLHSSSVVLCTLNAKYIHASLGLRYLLANMDSLLPFTHIEEFTVACSTQNMLNTLQKLEPRILGFGVYIWNTEKTLALIQAVRKHLPKTQIVLGGPEISHETQQQPIFQYCDYVVTGWGDISFPSLCRALLYGHSAQDPKPLQRVIYGKQPPLDQIQSPYPYYTDTDLKHRLIYVEASRGCPFKCEFCLSSLDKTAWAFPLPSFLNQMELLFLRGARHFKFVDRTFNLKIETAKQILQFFLNKLPTSPKEQHPLSDLDKTTSPTPFFLHFELIPDHLPLVLKDLIVQFPKGILQFEVGIQTFTPAVQKNISRRQNHEKTCENVQWLVQYSPVHIHADLLFGLPGETMQSFADSFDALYHLKPHEIQLGILKRLRGSPIVRHTRSYHMVFDSHAPYTLIENVDVTQQDVHTMHAMSRYWDLIVNSSRFNKSCHLLLHTVHHARTQLKSYQTFEPQNGFQKNLSHVSTVDKYSVFARFWHFTLWLWQRTRRTSQLSPEELLQGLFDYLYTELNLDKATVLQALFEDYVNSGAQSTPEVIRPLLQAHRKHHRSQLQKKPENEAIHTNKRQKRHLHSNQNTQH